MPTLIPSKATNAGGWPGDVSEERFPPSLGEGWKSGEEEEKATPPLSSSFGAQSAAGNGEGLFERLLPSSVGNGRPSMTGSRRPTVTTEGKFPSEVVEDRIGGKHDADTSGRKNGGSFEQMKSYKNQL